jgi:Transposase DDE domain/Transposase domain (DUF772)
MSLSWSPPAETSAAEDRILSRCKKAKLYVLLRQFRHELFDESFQSELAAMYPRRGGKEPVAPALLAMVTLLQAALGVSDEDAVEFAEMDKRWQMLLGTLGDDEAPFSQGSLVNFRQRLIAHDMDRRLLDRTVELARRTRGYSHTALRAAFDASPLFGAGRVEDTFNLLGRALREVLKTVADRLSLSVEEAAERVGVKLVTGTSIKAALDLDWDDPAQKKTGLNRLLDEVRAVEKFLETELREELDRPPLREQWQTVQQVIAQDTEPDPDGGGGDARRIRRGVARERRVSIHDGAMRHGRKSKSSRFDGFKRHLAVDVETGLIVGAAVLPGNRPEREAAGTLFADLERQGFTVDDLHIDRGYLGDDAVEARRFWDMAVHCKAFPLRNGEHFTKADFQLDFDAGHVTCPAGVAVPMVLGQVAQFPSQTCAVCPLRPRCTAAEGGRSLSIHRAEPFLVELRARQRTPAGRAMLRRRTVVEHRHADLQRRQGHKARYRGTRKNLFDVRRHAAVYNLFAAAVA